MTTQYYDTDTGIYVYRTSLKILCTCVVHLDKASLELMRSMLIVQS